MDILKNNLGGGGVFGLCKCWNKWVWWNQGLIVWFVLGVLCFVAKKMKGKKLQNKFFFFNFKLW